MYSVGQDRIEAVSASDLISKMHAASRAQAPSDFAWMVEVADRTRKQNGATIRVGTPEDFVADLIAAGMIKEGN